MYIIFANLKFHTSSGEFTDRITFLHSEEIRNPKTLVNLLLTKNFKEKTQRFTVLSVGAVPADGAVYFV